MTTPPRKMVDVFSDIDRDTALKANPSGYAIAEIAESDDRILTLTADLSNVLADFRTLFPERYIELGIAETNSVSLAAGLASCGYVPYIFSMSPFGVLKTADWTSVPIAGKAGPLATTLGVCDNVAAFKPNGHQAQIKEFLDFAYQDKYQLAFDKEYDLLPATTTATKALSSDPVFAPFLTALPNSVQYPSNTAWATVKSKIQQTIGLAVTGSPSTELTQLEQAATTSAG